MPHSRRPATAPDMRYISAPRPDGRYPVRVPLVDQATGQRVRPTVYARTLADAVQLRDDRLARARVGLLAASPERRTVGAWLEEWLSMCAPHLAAYSVVNYRGVIDRHLMPALGSTRLAALAPLDVQRFVAAQTAAGAAPRTVRQRASVLKAALQRAVDLELIPRNPAARVRLPPVPTSERSVLSAEQARRLLKAAAGDQLEALVAVGVGLGLRKGEALGLRWSDVDFEVGRLHVRVQSTAPGGKLVVGQPLKTPGSRATLPLPPPLAAALLSHRGRQRAWARDQEAWQEHGLVFTRPDGRPLPHRTFDGQLARLCASADVPCVSFHAARRTCASVLAALGVDLPTVAKILRHTNPSVTLAAYASTSTDQMHKAASKLGDALSG